MSIKVVDYLLVNGRSDLDLQNEVKVKLVDGWQPLGGPLVVPTPEGDLFIQALAKYE
jgi:hypothetical protein